jgi:hypothetical protein
MVVTAMSAQITSDSGPSVVCGIRVGAGEAEDRLNRNST